MAEWFVFVNTPYYPYVENDHEYQDDGTLRFRPIVADKAEDVFKPKGPVDRPTDPEETVFVAPFDAVRTFTA